MVVDVERALTHKNEAGEKARVRAAKVYAAQDARSSVISPTTPRSRPTKSLTRAAARREHLSAPRAHNEHEYAGRGACRPPEPRAVSFREPAPVRTAISSSLGFPDARTSARASCRRGAGA